MSLTSPGTVNAVLSVTADGSGADYTVRLSVSGQQAGLAASQTAVVTLSRGAAEKLAAEEVICRCFRQGALPRERIEAGRLLFDTVFHGDVAVLWATLLPIADAGHWVRVRLDVQPAELAALPWELVHTGGNWAFVHQRVSIWRGPVPKPLAADPDRGPRRILVVICNPADKKLLSEQEITGITGASRGHFGRQHVEILDGPSSKKALSAEIDRLRPHVLHFIGHGMPGADEDTELAFNWVLKEDANANGNWELSSGEIRLLADWSPRLVVMTACRTAPERSTAETSIAPSGGLTRAFLSAGVHAVVSMQADIQSKNVVPFSAALYRGIAEDTPLEEAVARARLEIYREDEDGKPSGDWALPILMATTDPADVLRMQSQATKESIFQVCSRWKCSELYGFVDQFPQRRDAMSDFEPLSYSNTFDSRRLLVIEGSPPVQGASFGKTWFAYWCLLFCFLRGHRVSYVDLEKTFTYPAPGSGTKSLGKNKGWLDAVRFIRESCIGQDQPEPLSPRAFDGFNAALNQLVSGPVKANVPMAGLSGPENDKWRPFNEDRRNAADRTRQICAAFLEALQAAADDRVHVIALDNADMILDESFRQAIYPGLIQPVVEGRYPAIRLVLVTRDRWTGLPGEDRDLWTTLSLRGFPPSQFMRLARDYCFRQDIDFEVAPKVKEIYQAIQGSWENKPGVPVGILQLAFNLISPGTGRP